MESLETRLKREAKSLGFDLAGIAPAVPADGFDRFQDWLSRGFAGEMTYLARRANARSHPGQVFAEVRSVIVVGMNYKPGNECPPSPPVLRGRGVGGEGGETGEIAEVSQVTLSPSRRPSPPGLPGGEGEEAFPSRVDLPFPQARIARYAQGNDYHDVLRDRLNRLLAWLQRERPDCRGRGVVDTAPLLERDFARRAGLGWFGKNTMLIDKRLGSYFFLGALLVDLDLRADPPHDASHCGSCTACLDACPTNAFAGPGWLDSRKCISYLTIELKGPVPEELRPGVGNWLFGCDVCQEVCPWNRKSPPGLEAALQPRREWTRIDPVQLLGLTEEDFRRRFRDTALMRTKRSGLVRNAAIVLGNTGDASVLPALERALVDPDPSVAEAVAWAIRQIRARSPECVESPNPQNSV